MVLILQTLEIAHARNLHVAIRWGLNHSRRKFLCGQFLLRNETNIVYLLLDRLRLVVHPNNQRSREWLRVYFSMVPNNSIIITGFVVILLFYLS